MSEQKDLDTILSPIGDELSLAIQTHGIEAVVSWIRTKHRRPPGRPKDLNAHWKALAIYMVVESKTGGTRLS